MPDAVAAVPSIAAAPMPKAEEYFRIRRAGKPHGSYFLIESVRVVGDAVIGREEVSAADVYGLTEARLLRMIHPEEAP